MLHVHQRYGSVDENVVLEHFDLQNEYMPFPIDAKGRESNERDQLFSTLMPKFGDCQVAVE